MSPTSMHSDAQIKVLGSTLYMNTQVFLWSSYIDHVWSVLDRKQITIAALIAEPHNVYCCQSAVDKFADGC